MPSSQPILWSPRKLRLILNWYPPNLFQRIHVGEVDPAYRWLKVYLKRSLLTRNFNGSAFGGSIYSAADPWFPILYWQALAREGLALQGWLKEGRADYKKPARSRLEYHFSISEADLQRARDNLDRFGTTVHRNQVEAIDRDGDVCAVVECVSYLRLLRPGQHEGAGF